MALGIPLRFEDVRLLARELPGVEPGTIHGAPSLKVRGRLMACPALHHSVEPDTLALRMDLETRAQLIAARPAIYYVTAHYENHPAVLVRLAQVSRSELAVVLQMSWRFVREAAEARRSGRAKA